MMLHELTLLTSDQSCTDAVSMLNHMVMAQAGCSFLVSGLNEKKLCKKQNKTNSTSRSDYMQQHTGSNHSTPPPPKRKKNHPLKLMQSFCQHCHLYIIKVFVVIRDLCFPMMTDSTCHLQVAVLKIFIFTDK